MALGVALTATILATSTHLAAASASEPGDRGPQAAVAAVTQDSPKSPPAVSSLAPVKGYQQVVSPQLTDTANGEVFGTVACPTGYRVTGGGAIIFGTSLAENLNSSYPSDDGLSWNVYVHNSSSTNGTFQVYAVCIKKISKYSVVNSGDVVNPAGAQTSASVTCPQGTFPLGGGGFSNSTSTAVNLNTSYPLSKGWRVDMNNGSTGTFNARAYAICGKKPTGYTRVAGTATTVNAMSQASAQAACPSGTSVLGGGSFSSSGAVTVNLNSTAPVSSTGWVAYQNNASSGSSSVTTYALCAAVS